MTLVFTAHLQIPNIHILRDNQLCLMSTRIACRTSTSGEGQGRAWLDPIRCAWASLSQPWAVFPDDLVVCPSFSFQNLSNLPTCSAVKKFQSKQMCSWNLTLHFAGECILKASSPAKIIKDLLSGWNSWWIAHTCQCQTTINREIYKRNGVSLHISSEIKWTIWNS